MRKRRNLFTGGGLLLLAARGAYAQSTFTNPIAPSGADPFVVLYNGVYYYTDTTGGNVSIAQSTTLPGVGSASMTTVYTPGSGMGNVWAPELQQVGGTWYVYFAMGPSSNTNNQRTYVLKDTTSSPMGPYSYVGQINDPTNDWAIDPTVLNYNNSSYLIWSGWAGSTNVAQNLYIAPMTSPTTIGNRVLISQPTNSWEQQGGPPSVNEGPVTLTSPGGQTSVIFSASGSWTDDYCLGQLELTGSNPLLSSSWNKDNAGPVFASANNVFGPGHSSYTTSDNGTRNWIVYHAAVSQGSGWTRNIRTQPFSWNPDGTPSFGLPVPVTCPIQWGPTNWVGAINESTNDTVHDYLNPANWVGGVVTDSFQNVTLTDNTTLYLSADHATTGNITFTYGSGQEFLSFQSNNSVNRTWTMNGNLSAAMLGGGNNIFISTPARPVTLAMGSGQRTFSMTTGNDVYIQGGLTGTAGLFVTGGGELIFQGAKTYTGPTVILQGTLSAGDGTSASSTANLPASTVVTVNSAGTLLLPGLSAGGANETISGLTGAGVVNGPTNPVTLTIAPTSGYTFSGQITGADLSLTTAGPATETIAGSANNWAGTTTITGGALNLTGVENGTSNLFVKQGAANIASTGSLTTTGFTSIGQSAGDNGSAAVSGALTVPGDLNVGDVSATGLLTITTGAVISCETFYVGKYATANGTVVQTGGSIGSVSGGGDWRIGGGNSASDSGAVGLYNLSGGSFNTSDNFQVGAYGTGTFLQSAGAVTVVGYLSIGRFPGATGTFNISGGSLTETAQPYLIVGEQGAGTLLVSSSATVNANTLSIGHNGGVGQVNQTGGSVTAAGVLLGMTAGGSGTYVLSGGSLSTASIFGGSGTGTFDFNGGTISPTANSTTFMQGLSTAADQSGGAVFNTSGFNITVNQSIVHASSLTTADGGLTKTGAGRLTLGGAISYTGNTTVTAGTLAFAPNTSATVLVRSLGSVVVSNGATLLAGAIVPNSGIAKTLLVAQNPVSVSGTLDLGINDLDVKNGNLTALTQQLKSAFNASSASWTGTGITSSAAAGNTSHLTALGITQNSYDGSALYSTFDGAAVTTTDVLIKYTYYGDANLDGRVDGSDYTRIDAGFLAKATGWINGDFNYDGVIDGSDYTLIDDDFNRQTAQITAQIAGPTNLIAAVPEPAGMATLAIAAAGLRRRRNRRIAAK